MKLKFGENLRRLRLNAGLTQEQLADIFGVSLKSVSRWETSGISYPDIELMVDISRYFGVTMDELLGCTDTANKSEINWNAYDALATNEEKYDFLLANKKMNPDNFDINYHLCELIPWNLIDNEDAVKTGIEAAVFLLENCDDRWYRKRALIVLGMLIPEEEIDGYIGKYFYDMDRTAHRLLEWRYKAHNDIEKYEQSRKENLLLLIYPDLSTLLHPHNDICTPESDAVLQGRLLLINLFNMLCCINEPKGVISGDGEVDLWSDHRLFQGFRIAHIYYKRNMIEKAHEVLLDSTELLEKIWALPEGTELTFRSPFLEGLKKTVEYTEYEGKKIIDAQYTVNDREFGLWIIPKTYLKILWMIENDYPDDKILLSVISRIEKLR